MLLVPPMPPVCRQQVDTKAAAANSSGLGPFTSDGLSRKVPWVIGLLHEGEMCPEDAR